MKLWRPSPSQTDFLKFGAKLLWKPFLAWLSVTVALHYGAGQGWSDATVGADGVSLIIVAFQLYCMNRESLKWRDGHIQEVQALIDIARAEVVQLELRRAELQELLRVTKSQDGEETHYPH